MVQQRKQRAAVGGPANPLPLLLQARAILGRFNNASLG
jgi:hypothetical protein